MKCKFIIFMLFSLPFVISCQKELSPDALKEKLSSSKLLVNYFAAQDSMKAIIAYNVTDLRNFDEGYVKTRMSTVKSKADWIRLNEAAGAKNFTPYYDASLRFQLRKAQLYKKYPQLTKMEASQRVLLFRELRKKTFEIDAEKYIRSNPKY